MNPLRILATLTVVALCGCPDRQAERELAAREHADLRSQVETSAAGLGVRLAKLEDLLAQQRAILEQIGATSGLTDGRLEKMQAQLSDLAASHAALRTQILEQAREQQQGLGALEAKLAGLSRPGPALDSAAAAQRPKDLPRHPRELVPGPLDFHPPAPTIESLGGGATLLLLSDGLLPRVHISLRLRGGSVRDPAGKEGLAALTAVLLRRGGSKRLAPAELDQALDELAAEVQVSADLEAMEVELDCLSRDLPRALELVLELLREPGLDSGRLDLFRRQFIALAAQRLEQPGARALDIFRAAVYGAHPYGRSPEGTAASLAAITRADLLDFHGRCWQPAGMVIGVSGAFEAEAVREALKKGLQGWPKADPWPPLPAPGAQPEPQILLDDRPAATQSTVLIGHLGHRRLDEDRLAATLLNHILGGDAFTSRIGQRVRSDEGLAYGVGTAFTSADQGGLFLAQVQTKTASTLQAIAIIIEELKRLCAQGVTTEELGRVQEAYLNIFVTHFERSDRLISLMSDLRYHGYRDDYLAGYRAKMAALTVEDLQRAAQRLLHPDRLVIAVVGAVEAMGGESRFKELGPVRRVAER